MAELVIDLIKLKYNIYKVLNLCKEKGLEIMGVVKGCSTHLPIIKTFQESGIKTLGLAKIDDAANMLPHLENKPVMITLPSPREAKVVAKYFKASLNSEIETIHALSRASDQNGTDHEVILMVDNGDLREGVMPEDTLRTVREILEIRSRHLIFCGLGSNLGCCSGILPDDENMNLLQELATDIEKYLGIL